MVLTYQVFSYDIIENEKGTYDYFHVRVNGQRQEPPGRVGNPATSLDPVPDDRPLPLWESGCRTATIDVTHFRGQRVTLEFAVHNGTYEDQTGAVFKTAPVSVI